MLELKNISKSYGEKKALHSVSITLENGVYGLLGPNGAGKSTLMNIITDNMKPDEGEVLWNNINIKELGASYREILGYAPQQQGLYDTFTGERFLAYMGTLKGIKRRSLKEEIGRAADYVNLSEVIRNPIASYSGGMKQRLLIAQAILGNPELIIMDEPTVGLDPKERVRIREKIASLAAERTILVATHVVSDVESIAREIILLKQGNVLAKAPVQELCMTYDNVFHLEDVYMKIFGEEENV